MLENDPLQPQITMREFQFFESIIEKITFITNKNKSKTTLLILKIMELNVRIAISQLFDNKQVYEEIPPVLILSNLILAPNHN
jgi:hypothetical protein